MASGCTIITLGMTLWAPERVPGLGKLIRSLGGSDGEASACSLRHPGSFPGLGRSPGEGNGYPLQCSCLENPVDRGAWWATVLGVSKSWTWMSNLITTRCISDEVVSERVCGESNCSLLKSQ